MKTEYMVVSMRRGEILHEELGPIRDLQTAKNILDTYNIGEYHLAYVAQRHVTEWEKI